MSKELLEIKDLYVNAGEKEILKGLNLKINKGEVQKQVELLNLKVKTSMI